MATKPTVPDLKELFKQAAEIAKQVPEGMQGAAFNRAIDLLTEGVPTQNSGSRISGKNPVKQKNSSGNTKSPSSDGIDTLLLQIDSTQHPGVTTTSKVLDRALMILQIAWTEHQVDGLTPPQIAKVLTEKFRIGTSNAAVSMALGNATDLVNRSAEGKGYKYRIMGPGEKHLANLGAADDAPTPQTRRRKKSTIPKKIKVPARATSKSSTLKSSRKSSVRPGPKIFLEGLIADGYFNDRRQISTIILNIQSTHAHTYKSTDLSPTLVRLLREGKLDRSKNNAGRYEYFAKS